MTERGENLFETHGVSPESSADERIAVGKALLIALGASGEISPTEMASFLAIATAYGASPDAIEALKHFDYTHARLADEIDVSQRLARHMMYDAIRVCRAEGRYGAAERNRVAAAGKALGAPPAATAALEALVESESALRRARAGIQRGLQAREKAAPPSALAGLADIEREEAALRARRISLMEENGAPAPSPARSSA